MALAPRSLTVALVTLFSSGGVADEIVRANGSTITDVEIKSLSSEQIQYRQPRVASIQSLRGEEAEDVVFTRAPGLKAARELANQGNYAEALELADKVMRSDPLYAEPAAFLKAEIHFRESVDTGAATAAEEAVKQLEAYLGEYKPKKGFYVPRAIYLLGKASLAANLQAPASSAFDELAAFPGDSRKLLAELGKAELALSRGEAQQASNASNALARRAKGIPGIYRQAMALRGRSLIAEKRYNDAIKELEAFVREPQGKEVIFDRYLAQAYNGLGDAYAGRGGAADEWEALYRYLWTTVILRSWRVECAEAFYKAAGLARKLGLTADADRLEGVLRGDFGATVWAGKLK